MHIYDSYVNVSSDQNSEMREKNKPKPLRLKSYRNEFEKYDDEDSSIYHAVGAIDNDSTHSADFIAYSNQSDGSYENVNATRRNPRGKLCFVVLIYQYQVQKLSST